mmetsp:Transcript_46064/g.100083  ORF Transcript_46064/g.100083 Transcript_46064/m.100083 type:complete len:402 (-) Transcript_46064:170-1375(-)
MTQSFDASRAQCSDKVRQNLARACVTEAGCLSAIADRSNGMISGTATLPCKRANRDNWSSPSFFARQSPAKCATISGGTAGLSFTREGIGAIGSPAPPRMAPSTLRGLFASDRCGVPPPGDRGTLRFPCAAGGALDAGSASAGTGVCPCAARGRPVPLGVATAVDDGVWPVFSRNAFRYAGRMSPSAACTIPAAPGTVLSAVTASTAASRTATSVSSRHFTRASHSGVSTEAGGGDSTATAEATARVPFRWAPHLAESDNLIVTQDLSQGIQLARACAARRAVVATGPLASFSLLSTLGSKVAACGAKGRPTPAASRCKPVRASVTTAAIFSSRKRRSSIPTRPPKSPLASIATAPWHATVSLATASRRSCHFCSVKIESAHPLGSRRNTSTAGPRGRTPP